MRDVLELNVARVNEELKQSFIDNFFSLMRDAKEGPNRIHSKYTKYKITFPHSDMKTLDKNEILDEIRYSYRIDKKMRTVAGIIGYFNFINNSFS